MSTILSPPKELLEATREKGEGGIIKRHPVKITAAIIGGILALLTAVDKLASDRVKAVAREYYQRTAEVFECKGNAVLSPDTLQRAKQHCERIASLVCDDVASESYSWEEDTASSLVRMHVTSSAGEGSGNSVALAISPGNFAPDGDRAPEGNFNANPIYRVVVTLADTSTNHDLIPRLCSALADLEFEGANGIGGNTTIRASAGPAFLSALPPAEEHVSSIIGINDPTGEPRSEMNPTIVLDVSSDTSEPELLRLIQSYSNLLPRHGATSNFTISLDAPPNIADLKEALPHLHLRVVPKGHGKPEDGVILLIQPLKGPNTYLASAE